MKIKYLKDEYPIESFELDYNLVASQAFDGTNYIDTGVSLFNEENINKDFKILFTINSYGAKQGVYSTIMNALDETTKDYFEILMRVYSSSENIENNTEFTPTKISICRK